MSLVLVCLGLLLLATHAFGASGLGASEFSVETATRAYVDTLAGDALSKSNAYFEGGYWIILWTTLVGLFVDLFILQSRWSMRFRQWAQRVTDRAWLQPGLYALPYSLASFLLFLPWTIYQGFFREKQYDLLSQSFGAWFGEQAISFALTLVFLPLFIIVLYAVIRRAPKTWWLWGTGVVALFIMLTSLLFPVFFAPLFNDFEEMAAGPLRDRIVAMAQAYDVPADRIYVFNQSKQHKRISANVSGFGPTIQISLNDNLLDRTTPEEVAAVMGHELGHYVLGHSWRNIIALSLLFGFGLFLVARIAPRLIDRYRERWGAIDSADPAALPVFSLLLTLFFLLATPALNTLIRVSESEADRFGLEAAREPDGFARVAMRLSEYRKIEPGPIEEMLFFDHPSGMTRVRMSMQWKQDNLDNPQIVRPPAPR